MPRNRLPRSYAGTIPLFNFRGGEVSQEWTNDPVRSGGFPKLYNLLPDGASLISRAGTIFKWDYSINPEFAALRTDLMAKSQAITDSIANLPTDAHIMRFAAMSSATQVNNAAEATTIEAFDISLNILKIESQIMTDQVTLSQQAMSSALAVYQATDTATKAALASVESFRDRLAITRGKNIRLIGYKFVLFPEGLGFEQAEVDADKILVVLSINQASKLTMEFRSFNGDEDVKWQLNPLSFDITIDDLDLSSNLNNWQFRQRYSDLFVLTDKGQVYKITPKLESASNDKTLYEGCTLSVETEKLGSGAPELGPSVAAIYYSSRGKPTGTRIQEVPFMLNDGGDDAEGRATGSFLYRTAVARPEVRAGVEAKGKRGAWWKGTYAEDKSFFLGGAQNASELPSKNTIVYRCTYVDDDGRETKPGFIFSVGENHFFKGLGGGGITEVDSPFYGPGSARELGQSFRQASGDFTNRDINNDACLVTCQGTGPTAICEDNDGNVNERNCFTVITDYGPGGTRIADARLTPNAIGNYDGVFSFGNANQLVETESFGELRSRVQLYYPKRFNGGHHRATPGTEFEYYDVNGNTINDVMGWHIVFNARSLRSGYRWINIYKKEVPAGLSEEQFEYHLFKTIRLTDEQMNADLSEVESRTLRLKSDGTTEIDGVENYPYTFRDDGEEVDRSISLGEDIYIVGDQNPKAIAFYQQRLFLGNFDKFPSLIRGSDVGFLTFRRRNPVHADDSIEVRPETGLGEVLRHMVSRNDLILLTDEATHIARGRTGIGPGNINIAKQDPYGAARLRPLEVEDSVLFFEKDFQKLRDYLYSFNISNYKGNDLMFYVKHLVRDHRIIDWTFQEGNPGVIWCVRDDGRILAMTYIKELEMIGWSVHELAGGFKAQGVQSIYVNRPGLTANVLYIVTDEGFVLQMDTTLNDNQEHSLDLYCCLEIPALDIESVGFFEQAKRFINQSNYEEVQMDIDGTEIIYKPLIDNNDITTLRYEILNRDDFELVDSSQAMEFFGETDLTRITRESFWMAQPPTGYYKVGMNVVVGEIFAYDYLGSPHLRFWGTPDQFIAPYYTIPSRDPDDFETLIANNSQNATRQPRASFFQAVIKQIAWIVCQRHPGAERAVWEGLHDHSTQGAPYSEASSMPAYIKIERLPGETTVGPAGRVCGDFETQSGDPISDGSEAIYRITEAFFWHPDEGVKREVIDLESTTGQYMSPAVPSVTVKVGFKMNCEFKTFSILTGYHLAGPRVLGEGPDLSVLTNPKGVSFDYVSSFPVWTGTVDNGIGIREKLFLNKFPFLAPGEKFTGRRPIAVGANWDENNSIVVKNIKGKPFRIAGISLDYE